VWSLGVQPNFPRRAAPLANAQPGRSAAASSVARGSSAQAGLPARGGSAAPRVGSKRRGTLPSQAGAGAEQWAGAGRGPDRVGGERGREGRENEVRKEEGRGRERGKGRGRERKRGRKERGTRKKRTSKGKEDGPRGPGRPPSHPPRASPSPLVPGPSLSRTLTSDLHTNTHTHTITLLSQGEDGRGRGGAAQPRRATANGSSRPLRTRSLVWSAMCWRLQGYRPITTQLQACYYSVT